MLTVNGSEFGILHARFAPVSADESAAANVRTSCFVPSRIVWLVLSVKPGARTRIDSVPARTDMPAIKVKWLAGTTTHRDSDDLDGSIFTLFWLSENSKSFPPDESSEKRLV